MRAVNLIPPEQRRGERTPLRSGPLAYLVVAALAVALAAVTAVVFTGNQVKEREAEVASLETREAEARARAESLSAFAQLASISAARFETVRTLARSRFDWERVLRELALVMPDDIWLVSLTGTVSPDVTVADGTEIALRSEAAGPALSLIGCGKGQEAVAGFIQALKDIDGVTRVGVASSALPGSGEAAQGGEDCRTRNFISKFEIVAAFDAVQVEAPAPDVVPTTPPAPSNEGGEAPTEAEGQQADNGSDVVSGVAR